MSKRRDCSVCSVRNVPGGMKRPKKCICMCALCRKVVHIDHVINIRNIADDVTLTNKISVLGNVYMNQAHIMKLFAKNNHKLSLIYK